MKHNPNQHKSVKRKHTGRFVDVEQGKKKRSCSRMLEEKDLFGHPV